MSKPTPPFLTRFVCNVAWNIGNMAEMIQKQPIKECWETFNCDGQTLNYFRFRPPKWNGLTIVYFRGSGAPLGHYDSMLTRIAYNTRCQTLQLEYPWSGLRTQSQDAVWSTLDGMMQYCRELITLTQQLNIEPHRLILMSSCLGTCSAVLCAAHPYFAARLLALVLLKPFWALQNCLDNWRVPVVEFDRGLFCLPDQELQRIQTRVWCVHGLKESVCRMEAIVQLLRRMTNARACKMWQVDSGHDFHIEDMVAMLDGELRALTEEEIR